MARKFQVPVTLPGLAVLIIALVVLVRSLSARNAYEILLSSAALVLWGGLCGMGAWRVRRLSTLEPLWKPPVPLGAASGEDWLVTGLGAPVPLFFRLHFLLRGRFLPQGVSGGGCPVFAETSLPRGSDTAPLSLSFPLGGIFRGEASCRLRDIFGLFSFPCGLPGERTIQVRSAPCGAKSFRLDPQSGAEDRRTKTSSDEERYYMREYAPGDRLRDINWKSSERIDTLITRISPDNQEKVTRVEVCFRNYGPGRPSLGDLWLLDRAKARLAWFLRSVKDEKDAYLFHVTVAAGRAWELKDTDEIDAFLDELAGLPFSPAPSEDPVSGEGGDLYVFSTARDTSLPAFLLARQGQPVSLFLALPPGGVAVEREELRLRDFLSGGSVPPARWLFPPKPARLPVPAGRAMIDYAEVRL